MTFTDGQLLARTAVKVGSTHHTWSKLKTAYVNVKQRYAIE